MNLSFEFHHDLLQGGDVHLRTHALHRQCDALHRLSHGVGRLERLAREFRHASDVGAKDAK